MWYKFPGTYEVVDLSSLWALKSPEGYIIERITDIKKHWGS